MAFKEKRIDEFLEVLASSAPTPGGGTVAALCGALGTSLLVMVGEITMTKKKPEDKSAVEKALANLRPLRARFEGLMDDDAASFDAVMTAFKLPKDDARQETARKAAIEKATIAASEVPLATATLALDALALAKPLAELGAKSAISDVAVGAACLETCCRAAAYNVKINLGGIEGEEARRRLADALAAVEKRAAELADVRLIAEGRL